MRFFILTYAVQPRQIFPLLLLCTAQPIKFFHLLFLHAVQPRQFFPLLLLSSFFFVCFSNTNMNSSSSIEKCQSKITHIEGTRDIMSLQKNFRNYHSFMRKQKKYPSLQNTFSKDDFNTYNTYLGLKRKISNYHKAQEVTSQNPITQNTKRKRSQQMSNISMQSDQNYG